MDIVTSTPALGSTGSLTLRMDASPVAVTSRGSSQAVGPKRPIGQELVIEAVEAVGDKRKGASLKAIKKYIEGVQEHPLDSRTSSAINRAVKKALDGGKLDRPASNKSLTGLMGCFIVPKVHRKKKEKIPKEQVSDSETLPKKKVSKKINLSDTAIEDLKVINNKAKTTKKPTNSNKQKILTENDNIKKASSKTAKSGARSTKVKQNVDNPKTDLERIKPIKKNAREKKNMDKLEIEVESENKEIKTKGRGRPKKEKITTDYGDSENIETNIEKKAVTKPDHVKKGKVAADVKGNAVETKTGKEKTIKTKEKTFSKINNKKVKAIKEIIDSFDEEKDAVFSEDDDKENVNKSYENEELDASPQNLHHVTERQDVSDSELVVSKPSRKSTKSYSSDTEVGTVKEVKSKSRIKKPIAKQTKVTKEEEIAKPKMVKGKKLYSSIEKGLEQTRSRRRKN